MTSRAESCPPKLVPRNAIVDKPNPALQGAARAFSARSTDVSPPTNPLSTAQGAAATAAAAGTRSLVKTRPALRPVKRPDIPQPVNNESPSRSAALAASARASPQKDGGVEKTSSQPKATHASSKSPKLVGDSVRTQNSELGQDSARGRPWLDNTIAIPQPVRPLSASAALTAILGLDPEVSPASTPHSASPLAMPPNASAGLSAARLAAKRATPAAPSSDHSLTAFVDRPVQSRQSMDPLSISTDAVQPPLETEGPPGTSSMHSARMPVGRHGRENARTTDYGGSNDPESTTSLALKHSGSVSDIANTVSGGERERAASSAMQRTASYNDSLLSASKSPLSHTMPSDAIIAWSVASSRAASPAKAVPPPTLRRRSRSFGVFHHRQKWSDPKAPKSHAPIHLKHTLRKHRHAAEEDEENAIVKRGRRHFIRKHQHKHHEGDRKRWRDRVTERERKRYEGVWAANRGLFTFWDFSTTAFENLSKPPTEMDAVLNIVVREVWERSRLPRSELEEVWDLVARKDSNTLRRDEFVVGMWLLDQRLKGRKLPPRVSASVWASVRHTLNIRAKP